MYDNHESSQSQDIVQEFTDMFRGTEVEQIFATSYPPDTPNPYSDREYQNAFNLALGDDEKARKIYEVWWRFDQALPIIQHSRGQEDSFHVMIRKADILVRYTTHFIDEILGDIEPDL